MIRPDMVRSDTSLSKQNNSYTDSSVLKEALSGNPNSRWSLDYHLAKLVYAAQEAIKKAKSNMSEVQTMKKQKMDIFKSLIKQQEKQKAEFTRRRNKKGRHIDINGIIDGAVRTDGWIGDVHANKIVYSKRNDIYDYKFKDSNKTWKPTKFSQDELMVLFHVKKLMVFDSKLLIHYLRKQRATSRYETD